MRLPPRTTAHAASSEVPLASRGETLFAVALLTSLAIWAAHLSAGALERATADTRPAVASGVELPQHSPTP